MEEALKALTLCRIVICPLGNDTLLCHLPGNSHFLRGVFRRKTESS